MKRASKADQPQPRIRESREGEFERLWTIDQACFDRELAYSRAELQFYMRTVGAFTLLGVVSALAIYKHKGNIQRLLKGTENRIGGKNPAAAADASRSRP